jgi:hypothetical protein
MVNNVGRQAPVGNLWRPEQMQLLSALLTSKRVLVLKPRQIGATTLACAYIAWLILTAPRAVSALSVGHDGGAQFRTNQMVRTFLNLLPGTLKPKFRIDNQKAIQLNHNDAQHRALVAGGRGQGKSFSYHFIHFTEAGMYPRGISSGRGR